MLPGSSILRICSILSVWRSTSQLRLEPRLLQHHVVTDVGRELRPALAVELHVSDGAIDDPGREAVGQPLKRRPVHPLAIVHERLQRGKSLQRRRVADDRLRRAGLPCTRPCRPRWISSRSLPVGQQKPWPCSAASIRSCSAGSLNGADAAVDEGAVDDRAVAGVDLDFFRREIGRRGRARPDDLRQTKGAVLRGVFPAPAVVQRPGTARVEPLGHDHEAGADRVAVERRVRAELLVQFLLEGPGWELRRERSLKRLREPLCDEPGLEDARADTRVELLQRVDRHAARKSRRDDRSGRRAADEIEIIAKKKVRILNRWRSIASMTARYSRVRIPRIPPPSSERMRFGPWSGSRCCCLVRGIVAFPLPSRWARSSGEIQSRSDAAERQASSAAWSGICLVLSLSKNAPACKNGRAPHVLDAKARARGSGSPRQRSEERCVPRPESPIGARISCRHLESVY